MRSHVPSVNIQQVVYPDFIGRTFEGSVDLVLFAEVFAEGPFSPFKVWRSKSRRAHDAAVSDDVGGSLDKPSVGASPLWSQV